MNLDTKLCLVILGAFFSFILVLSESVNESKKLDGYKFPVYSTPLCPRNELEWKKRSKALNCNDTNGYMCFPNENLTKLLEFCFVRPWIWIEEGSCLFLRKNVSNLFPYKCRHFIHGCHNTSYQSKRIFENQACISIGNGCFLAEQSCKSTPNISHRPATTENDKTDRLCVVILIGTIVVFVCNLSCVLYFNHKKRKFQKCDLEEGKPLITNTENEKMDCSNIESPVDKAILEQWGEDNEWFVSSRACNVVENKTASQNLVIVTGHSGSGKSAIIQHIALNYLRDGWIVKPVKDMEEIVNAPFMGKNSNKILFVFNDPLGKESLDEILYNKWQRYEEALPYYLKRAKLLMSCRKFILSDRKVKGLFSDMSNVVDINIDCCKLTEDEKRSILKIYKIDETLSEEECAEIVQIEDYFPLLCKLYSKRSERKIEGLKFFKEPDKSLENEIRGLRETKKEQYCALILIILFNNDLCIDEIPGNDDSKKKFEHALELCGMDTKTAPYMIGDNLKSLKGFLVKQIQDNYQFYHDFVMEVTTFIVGTDYPKTVIKYADIGFLRRRVRLKTGNDSPEKFTIYLSDRHIDHLVKRLYSDIFGERLLEVVLNPCLQNKKVKKVFEETLKSNLEMKQMLLEKIELQTDNQKLHQKSNKIDLSKLAFALLENKVSCLFALIVFGHTDLSLSCLKTLQETKVNLTGRSLFPAVCCNGSVKLFNWCLKKERECLTEKWGGLSPIHIVIVFHNSAILRELINKTDVDVNLMTDKENEQSPSIKPTEKDTNINTNHKNKKSNKIPTNEKQLLIHNKENIHSCLTGEVSPLYIACSVGNDELIQLLLNAKASINLCKKTNGISPLAAACFDGHDSTVQLLLKNGANINLYEREGASPLFIACQNGHDRTVQLLLRNEADINSCMAEGASPLYIACFAGHDSTVKLLLSNGADINLCQNNGASPLHAACYNGHDSTVKLLMSNGVDINLCMEEGASPLFSACMNGHDSTVQLLLSNKADINLCTKDGASPLYIACFGGHDSTVQLLLSNGADINLCKASLFYVACYNGFDSTVQLLLSNGANINLCSEDGTSPLSAACYNGHDSTVQLLLSNGADINLYERGGASPLYRACENGHDSTVQLLLCNGADINLFMENGTSPLSTACQNGHDTTVQLLLSNVADNNLCKKIGAVPLYMACQNGHDSTVKLLLRNGADINLCMEDGSSPLYIACYIGHESTVELLLSNGADINLCDKDGASPLIIACSKGHDRTVHLLLTNEADIDLCDKDGTSALYAACYDGHDTTVQLLLNDEADINLCNKNGASPLHAACYDGHDSTVQLLLRNRADINLCKKNGVSSLHAACQNGHDSTVQLLLSNGAGINLCTKNGASPLSAACQNGHDRTLQLLLSNGADINLCTEDRSSPVYIACQNGHDSIVQLLLRNGANINLCKKNGVSPLYIACQNGHDSTVQLLLSNGADINLCKEDGASPLYIACEYGHDNTVKHLLSNGADINLCTENGDSPLYIACQNGHDSTIQLLLSNGADIDLCKENGASPFSIACENGHVGTN